MEILQILCVVVLMVILGLIYLGRSISIKEEIEREIRRNGGRAIEISQKFWGGSAGSFTYKVVFIDRFGKKHSTSCHANGTGKHLFWTHTPKELIHQEQITIGIQIPNSQGDDTSPEHKSLKPAIKSSREQIIDNLHEENLRLKAEIERLQNYNNLNED